MIDMTWHDMMTWMISYETVLATEVDSYLKTTSSSPLLDHDDDRPVPVLYFSTSRVPANTNGDSYSSATEEPLAARVNSDHHLAFMI